jgi:hypothetical protein
MIVTGHILANTRVNTVSWTVLGHVTCWQDGLVAGSAGPAGARRFAELRMNSRHYIKYRLPSAAPGG